MSKIVVTCGCGRRYEVPQSMAGQQAKCNGCGQVLNLVAPQAAPLPTELGATAADVTAPGTPLVAQVVTPPPSTVPSQPFPTEQGTAAQPAASPLATQFTATARSKTLDRRTSLDIGRLYEWTNASLFAIYLILAVVVAGVLLLYFGIPDRARHAFFMFVAVCFAPMPVLALLHCLRLAFLPTWFFYEHPHGQAAFQWTKSKSVHEMRAKAWVVIGAMALGTAYFLKLILFGM